MPSLKDFVAALQAGWFPALAALVGCSIIIAGDYFRLPYLSSTPGWLLTTAVFVGIFSFSILVANIVYLPVVIWKAIKRRRAKAEFKQFVRREIESAPDAEIAILAYLVTANRKAFQASLDDRRLTPLVTKGLIIQHGGTHNMMNWPYTVHPDVWDYLMENRERFRMEMPDQFSDPFHWRNAPF